VATIQESSEGSRYRDDPSTTGISVVDIGCEIGRLVDASMASNTKDIYKVGLDSFQAFRVEYNLDLIWPPPPSHIVLFVAYLSLKGKAHSTARCYVAAIGFRCKILQSNSVSQDFSQNFIVSKILEVMKRTKSLKDSRLPITLELLTKIIDKLSSICFSSYEALLFATTFTFAFHGFLRVGEIVYTKPGQAHQIIGLKDVTVVKVGDLQSMKVRINHSSHTYVHNYLLRKLIY
jgi:hypothetical protein